MFHPHLRPDSSHDRDRLKDMVDEWAGSTHDDRDDFLVTLCVDTWPTLAAQNC